MILSRHVVLAFLAASFFVIGCSNTANIEINKTLSDGEQPLTVAVLPFTKSSDISKEEGPDWLLREVFFDYFSYQAYRDIPLEEVDRRLDQAGFGNTADIKAASPSELRSALGADAVIHGHILSANNITAGIFAETRIEARLELIDLRSGESLWQIEHTESEMSGILQSSLVTMYEDQRDNLDVYNAYYKVAESFSIKAIDQIPDPSGIRSADIKLPGIEDITANIHPDKIFAANEVIEVRMTGEAGLKAHFDIGSWRTAIPMKEVQPGHYEGRYTVRPEDLAKNVLIIGSLKNEQGFIRKKVYRSSRLQIAGNGV